MEERKETKWRKPTKFRVLRKWQPGVWLPEYESIVADSCKGVSNEVIAKQYNFTPQHISNILNTEEARTIKQEVVKAIRQRSLDLMDTQYSEIVSKSVENVHTVLHETITKENMFGMFDRSVMALKGLGKLQEEAKAGVVHNNTQQNILVITNGQETAITKGLKDLVDIATIHKNVNGDSIK
jgi:hypothetical protein